MKNLLGWIVVLGLVAILCLATYYAAVDSNARKEERYFNAGEQVTTLLNGGSIHAWKLDRSLVSGRQSTLWRISHQSGHSVKQLQTLQGQLVVAIQSPEQVAEEENGELPTTAE